MAGDNPKWEHRMSEQTAEATETETTAATTSEKPDAEIRLPDDHPLVRTLAAQKETIRGLKEKAQRLDEIEESQKSDAEKAAERLAKAEQTVREAEARVLRRDIAIENKLSKEDAEMLDSLTDEGAMRRLAERLANANEDERNNGNRVPTEGTHPTPKTDPRRSFLQEIRGEG